MSTQSPTLLAKLKNVLLGFIVLFVWMLAVNHFLNFLYPATVPPIDSSDAPPPFLWELFFTIIWPPIWEELVFRHAPGLIVKRLDSKFILPVMIISSFIFANGHSSGTQLNVLRQGVMGMILFYVYLKNGYSYWSSLLLHISWNAFVFFSPDAIW
jgi:membrane protease YdiL (CAAX protease family)